MLFTELQREEQADRWKYLIQYQDVYPAYTHTHTHTHDGQRKMTRRTQDRIGSGCRKKGLHR